MNEENKRPYAKPMVFATYSKEELEETIKPHGSVDSYTGGGYPPGGGGGCGCGGGSILIN